MSTPHAPITAGDPAQLALLARFTRQTVRHAGVLSRPRRQPQAIAPPPSPTALKAPQTASILSDTERQAALQLRAAWLAFIGSKAQPSGDSDYEIWRGACRLAHLSPLLCADVVCTGFTLDEADARYKMQSGTARNNMHKCLGIFMMQNG